MGITQQIKNVQEIFTNILHLVNPILCINVVIIYICTVLVLK